MLPLQDAILNIRYDAPDEVWRELMRVYERMPGWLGAADLPRWLSADETGQSQAVWASVEPGGLQLAGYMEGDDWIYWLELFTTMATEVLGYEVGDVRDGYM